LLSELAEDDSSSRVVATVINGLAATWPTGRKPGDSVEIDFDSALAKLMKHSPAESRGKLIKLASTWGVKGLDEQLKEITKAAFATLADAKAKDADRISAAQQIVEFQPDDDEAAAKLLAVITADASPALTDGVFEALSQSKAKNIGAAIVAKLRDLPPSARPAALRLVLAKTDSAKAFLDAVEKGTLRFDMLALDQRQALASHPDKEISTRAK